MKVHSGSTGFLFAYYLYYLHPNLAGLQIPVMKIGYFRALS